MRTSGEQGNRGAQVDLANLLLLGPGSTDDSARVAQWFEEAAKSGDLVLVFNLGMCLARGVGVERDDEQSAQWLRRAADGVVDAQYIYARMLTEGRGVECNLPEARAWFARAAQAGMPEAEVALGEMMTNGRGGPRDLATALELFANAADKGHSGAMFALGVLRSGGHDFPMDREVANAGFVRPPNLATAKPNSCSAGISLAALPASLTPSRRAIGSSAPRHRASLTRNPILRISMQLLVNR